MSANNFLPLVMRLFALLVPLAIVAGCDDIKIFGAYAGQPLLKNLKSLTINEKGQLELAWPDNIEAADAKFDIYLQPIDAGEASLMFSDESDHSAPMTSEIVEIPSNAAPHIKGAKIEFEKAQTLVLNTSLQSGQPYLLEIFSKGKDSKQDKKKVILFRLDFQAIEGGFAEIRDDRIHIEWNKVPGANKCEIFADAGLSVLLGTATENFLELPVSNSPTLKKYYLRPARGILASAIVAEVKLSSRVKITSVLSSKPDGIYHEGESIDIDVKFSQAVVLKGEGIIPFKGLTTFAKYLSGSGTSTLKFRYNITAGDETSKLETTGSIIGSYEDLLHLTVLNKLPAEGSKALLSETSHYIIDSTPPTLPGSVGFASYYSNVTSVSIGYIPSVDNNFSTHLVKMCTSSDCSTSCTSASSSTTNYATISGVAGSSYYACVQGIDAASHSSNWAVSLNPIIIDQSIPSVSSVTSTLPAGTYGYGAVVPIQVHFSEPVFVTDGPSISLQLETGSIDHSARYLSGSGSNILNFEYIVLASDVSSDLNYVTSSSLNIGSTGVIVDAAGNLANRTLPDLTANESLGGSSAVILDAVLPSITDVTSTNSDDKYGPGSSITIKITTSRAVTVASASPRLTLNTIASSYATYVSAAASVLTFSYTVGAGEVASDLNYASTTALDLNGATIRDSVGNNLILTLPALTDSHSLGTQKNLVIDGNNHAPDIELSVASQDVITGSAIASINARSVGTLTDQDADGEILSYSCSFDATSNGIMDAGSQDCTNLPMSGFSFSSSTGVLTWTPSTAASSSATTPTDYEIAITAVDPFHYTDTAFATVNVLKNFQTVIPYTAGTSASYTLTNSAHLDFSGNLVRLNKVDQLDDDGTSTGFSLGYNGANWDSTSNTVKFKHGPYCGGDNWNCSAGSGGSWRRSGLTPILDYGVDGIGVFSPTPAPNRPSFGLMTTKVWFVGTIFDGTNHYLVKPLDFSDTFTISIWIKTTQSYQTNSCANWYDGVGVVSANAAGDLNDFGIFMCDGYVQVGVGNPNTMVRSLAPYNDGSWHYITFIRGKTDGLIKLYVDGLSQGSTTGNMNSLTASPNLYLASDNDTSTTRYSGELSKLFIVGEQSPVNDIRMLYDRQRPGHSGDVTSRIIDAGTSVPWTGISWKTLHPAGKELPDFASNSVQSESTTDYPGLPNSALMNSNVGLWHLNETVLGTVATSKDFADRSGQANHGVAQNSVGLTAPGRLNNAPRFRGNGEISIASSSVFAFGTGNFTISGWVRYGLGLVGRNRIVSSGFAGTANGFSLEIDPTGDQIALGIGCAGGAVANCVYIRTTESFANNDWHHVTAVVDRTSLVVSLYVDGVKRNIEKVAAQGDCGTIVSQDLSISSCTTLDATGGGSMHFGSDGSTNRFVGQIDEVAMWSRALNATEAATLYKRGGNRILFQVRSCAQSDCNDGSWKGPDGTSETNFTELNNTTDPVSTSGIVKPSSVNIQFADYPGLTIADNRYFQYRAYIEADELPSPELKSVEVLPFRYYTTKPTIVYNTAVNHRTFAGLTEIPGGLDCSAGLRYQLSKDNITWYYFDGTNWVTTNTVENSNSASDLETQASAYATLVGRSSNVYVKTIFTTSAGSPCELDDLAIRSNEFY